MSASGHTAWSRFVADYGMVFVLLLLCAFFSWVTVADQFPVGDEAAEQVATELVERFGADARSVVVARDLADDTRFASAVEERLIAAGVSVLAVVRGGPADARRALEEHTQDPAVQSIAVAANQVTGAWGVYDRFPAVGSARVVVPQSYRSPNFLKADNLLNIANQIVVIAILAIGMTLVIVTGGIDLSVGSLIALAAVIAALGIRDLFGAEEATAIGMVLSCGLGIAVCAGMGLFSGVMVTAFAIPPFIATLGMMLIASGAAYMLADGQSVYQIPDSFVGLGRGTTFAIPNAVILMVALYGAAHVLMSRMTFGRFVYAVGGNREAARLSGVPVRRVLLLVYTLCGALAGLGGVVMASQLKSGAPTYGLMYELYVIAAVVVGGTSLAGGEGKVLGTLIGAFIIAVIQNGMNLTGIESYTQKVVLGLVILGAVMLDMWKRRRAGP